MPRQCTAWRGDADGALAVAVPEGLLTPLGLGAVFSAHAAKNRTATLAARWVLLSGTGSPLLRGQPDSLTLALGANGMVPVCSPAVRPVAVASRARLLLHFEIDDERIVIRGAQGIGLVGVGWIVEAVVEQLWLVRVDVPDLRLRETGG